MHKKRRHKRIIKRLPVKFGTSEANLIGFTSDVSPGGIFIRTSRGLPPETHIAIDIETPSGEIISIKGIVKRTIKYSTHLGNVMKNGMGVEIMGLNEDYINFIKNYYNINGNLIESDFN